MKTAATIFGMASLFLLIACERQAGAPAPVAPPAEPAVAAQAVEPAPPVVVVSQEVAEDVSITIEEAIETDDGSDAVTESVEADEPQDATADEEVAGAEETDEEHAAETDEAVPDAELAEPAPVFSLADATLDPAVLTRQKISVTEEEPRVLTFGVDSVPLALTVEALPVGAAPRTLIAAVKTLRITRDVTPVMYGRTDDKQLCAFSVNHRLQYSFWGFGADLSSSQDVTDEWVVLAFSYDGTTGKIYINGGVASSAPMTLKTEASPLILGGRGFAGSIAAVRVFDVALGDEQVAKLSAAHLAALAGE